MIMCEGIEEQSEDLQGPDKLRTNHQNLQILCMYGNRASCYTGAEVDLP